MQRILNLHSSELSSGQRWPSKDLPVWPMYCRCWGIQHMGHCTLLRSCGIGPWGALALATGM